MQSSKLNYTYNYFNYLQQIFTNHLLLYIVIMIWYDISHPVLEYKNQAREADEQITELGNSIVFRYYVTQRLQLPVKLVS